MYNDSTIRPHVEAVRQADTYFKKGQHDMAAHKLYATQGALEQAIKKNIETGGNARWTPQSCMYISLRCCSLFSLTESADRR